MYFRDIGIHFPRDDATTRDYLLETEHVVGIFLQFMPRKYELDGMAKTNIFIGPAVDEPKYHQALNVNIYHFEGFDENLFQGSSRSHRDEMMLEAIEASLLDIALDFDADPAPIKKAADATRDCKFDLKVESKLSRSTKSRRLRLCVYCRMRREGIEWGIDIKNRKREVLDTIVIDADSNLLRSSYDYRKSNWKGTEFVIRDFVDQETFRIDAAPLESKLDNT
ncbi:hypothetical protein [Stratiformator vulcanicus]|uniref:Uncharacterized protein n=1 Tax=Stratiformator vulcanicus TaxID=2527980 RepID=A0A517R625_9PLAN|nr:hypothetical protein [Stratiformator vulcanicus]QDT39338.1 hypothetical protein Pan189_37440 [Stratiformator vulcanicus]